jgi:anthranilate phosphoribosyltransferase
MEGRTGTAYLIEEASGAPHTALRELLYADERWRDWARVLMRAGVLKRDLLAQLWRVVLEFDPVLAEYAVNPLPIGEPAVLVAGSGKETFQTFNVSTAAGILAAAAGARVVKGVSHSVSAVSGSADVLDQLGIPITSNPLRVQEPLDRHGIAFVSYAAFCPTYAGRYDGVFPFLTPFSFFMPVSVLGVRASAFVYGIAHRDVVLAAEAIHAMRPDLARGLVVATDIASGETMDEYAGYGISHTARLNRGRVSVFRGEHKPPPVSWKTAVAHRDNHRANADMLAAALRSEGSHSGTELVERNAALILTAPQEQPDEIAALARVREARISGGAAQLLSRLQAQNTEVI